MEYQGNEGSQVGEGAEAMELSEGLVKVLHLVGDLPHKIAVRSWLILHVA